MAEKIRKTGPYSQNDQEYSIKEKTKCYKYSMD